MSDLALSLRAALNAARKSQEKARALVLGTILANLKNRELELGRTPTNDETVEVIRKGIKLRRDAAEQFAAAGRADLADTERHQIQVLEEFLPPAADPAEIRAAARAAIGAGARDLGRVMSVVMPQFKGRAEGKLINQIVREELQAG